MKNPLLILLVIGVLGVVGIGAYVLTQGTFNGGNLPQSQGTGTPTPQPTGTQEPPPSNEPQAVIGKSVQGRDITAYHYGDGEKEVLFVGGMHGGYEWNTVLLAYEFMDYLEANFTTIPQNIEVTVIPVLNPDGLQKVVGTAGRFTEANVPSSQAATVPGLFNANNVDLNRNFDCDWQPTGIWQSRQVDAGSKVFSEPESQAIRDYVQKQKPAAVVMWYSAAGGVFASNCHNGVLPETRAITKVYSDASGYPAYEDFDFYQITGDAINWLAKNNIPAISVLLTTHEDVEWDKNRAGIEALLEYYAK